MADSTLAAIRKKVRRLTRSPSTTQLSDVDLDEYVNTFVQYDMPENLRLHTLRDNFVFYTEPDVDTYGTSIIDPNVQINTDKPIYIAGKQAWFVQDQEGFYQLYPKVNFIGSVGSTGDGATTAFAGTLSNRPILKNHVTFVSIDANNDGLRLSDDGAGSLSGDGTGTINYLTGAFTLNFSAAPASGETIESETVPYVAAQPEAALYFNNEFVIRPVPDKVYRVEVQIYKRATELLAAGSSPDLEQWWQYIAYGAAKKIFEDRTDIEGAALIMPEFKHQETLVLRRTIVQQTKERAATIYTEQTDNQLGGWGWRGP